MFKSSNGHPPLFFIYLTIFVNIIGFGMVFPLLPYYAREFHASEITIGFLGASFAIAQFIFSPIWGRFSDRFGRKPIIAMALLGNVFAFLAFAYADSLVWLFISRFLQGVFSAAALPVAQAYVADVTTKEERVKGMGNLGASLALGFIFGPTIGGTLAEVNHQLPFFVAAAVAFVNFISVQLILPESLTKKAEKLVLKDGFMNFKHMHQGLKGELGSLFILAFLWSYALSNNQVAVPLFGFEVLGLGPATIGYLFGFMGLTSAFMQSFAVHKITKRLGEHRTVVLGIFLMAIALLLMPFSPVAVVMGMFMVAVSVGSGMSRPTMNSLISKSAVDGQGATMGIASAFESAGRMVSPIMGGVLFTTFGHFAPFWVSSFFLLATLWYIVFKQKFLKAE